MLDGSAAVWTWCLQLSHEGMAKLQGIALLWTLLVSGHASLGGDPIAKRVIICCPTSLVSNWDSECQKWLKVGARSHDLGAG